MRNLILGGLAILWCGANACAVHAVPVEAVIVAAEDPEAETSAMDEASYFTNYEAQPAAAAPSFSAPPAAAASTAARSARSQYVRMSRAPNMFGDSLTPGSQFNAIIVDRAGQVPIQFTTDLPLGSGSNSKIAENNKALPMDRVYFVYNHFHNALTSTQIPGPGAIDGDVDRYSIGFEKTFFDGNASLEIRMPLVSGFNTVVGNSLALQSQNIGDLTFFTKQVLYADDELLMAAGLGLSLPTASNIDGQIGGQAFALENDAIHLLPYVGFLLMPSDDLFVQGFLELDFAADGNDLLLDNQFIGTLTPQNLFHVNFSVGRWLYRNEDARYLQGIAGIFELHYATTIQDADVVPFAGPGFAGALGGAGGRVDYLNLTAGLQTQIGPLSSLRVAVVTPLRTGFDRQFDAEVQVSFNRLF